MNRKYQRMVEGLKAEVKALEARLAKIEEQVDALVRWARGQTRGSDPSGS